MRSDMTEREGQIGVDERVLASEDFRVARQRELSPNVRFEGFTPEQQNWVARTLETIGLPLERVGKLTYKANGKGPDGNSDGILGMVDYLGSEHITLFHLLGQQETRQQVGTHVHELAHNLDPSIRENFRLYGGVVEAKAAQRHATLIAQQSLRTRVALNEYHAGLLAAFEKGNIGSRRYIAETHAIMLQMRLTDSDKLLEVQEKQLEALKAKKGGRWERSFVEIVSEKGTSKAVGVDRTIIALMQDLGIDSLQKVEKHIESLAQNIAATKQTPLSPAA